MEHTLEKPVILIVEDGIVEARSWKRLLEPEAHIVIATTIERAEEQFHKRRAEILVIAMDEHVPGRITTSTVDLVHTIRASGWRGVIIPTSDNPVGQQKLIDAGANAEYTIARKHEVPEKIREAIASITSPKSGAP